MSDESNITTNKNIQQHRLILIVWDTRSDTSLDHTFLHL